MKSRRSIIGLVLLTFLAGLMMSPEARAADKPKVVLDPDDNFSFGIHDGTTYTELPITHAIAQAVQAQLPSVCDSNVVITRDASQNFVNRSSRAAQMHDADVSVTLSLNGLTGTPWGIEADGGSSAYTTTAPANLAFGTELLNQLHARTGRPAAPVNEAPTNGTVLPYPEFAALPNTYAQIFMLYIDHNYDWPVIQQGRDLLVDAVVAALGRTLQAKGFKCLGSFPPLPSAARLQQLRNLGYQNFLKYGADPVSMSTGNFATSERVFALSGVGRQLVDLTLNYNAQSFQDSPVGVGWTFAYGSFVQQYSDGSVVVNLADGRAFLFASDGSDGFTTPTGAFASLSQPDASTIRWTSTTGSGMTFSLDAAGRGALTSATDRQGNSITLSYGGAGGLFPKLTGITDQAGQHIAVTTDGDGRITSFTRPDGALWRLGYSAAGDLISITSARGTVRSFGYDDLHRMTSEVGQDGVTYLTNTYDADSRVVKQTNAFGQERTIVYDDANRRTTYTDTTGAETVYDWNALGAVTKTTDALGGEIVTDYNDGLQPTSETNPLGQTVATAYAPSGQVASVTDSLGNVVSATYNASGDLTSRTDEGGAGGSARTTSFTVNGDGLPTTITNPDGTTQTRTYNAFGDVLTATDELGHATTYGYDSRGNTTSVTDTLGRVTTMTYDLANRLTSVSDPRGHTTSYSYDPNDNLTTIGYPDGSSEHRSYDVNDQLASSSDRRGAVTTYAYDAELNVTDITLPNGGVIKSSFDGENRLTSITDALGNKTTYTLDALGRRIAAKDPRGNTVKTDYDAAGRISKETDAVGAVTEFVRDANGRVLTVTDPAGGTTSNEWDDVGRLTAVVDQLGHRTSHTFNFRDQIVTTVDPADGVITSDYDEAGRLESRTDQAGAATGYEHDAAGQTVKITDALGGVTTMNYDLAGNRISATDPNGHTTTTSYDAMNEPISTTDALGRTSSLARDAGGLVIDEADPLGHHTAHAYDVMGDRISTTDALGRTTHFGYDLNRRQTSETAPDGMATSYELDEVGNLVGVVQNARPGEPSSATVNVKTSGIYDARNLLTSITDANGATTVYGHDLRGLLISSTDPLGNVTSYAHDKAGNRSKRIDGNGAATNYAYDPRDLLLKRAYPDGTEETFTYDKVGRQLTATNARGTVTTTYDALGRTTKVTDASGKSIAYGHDAAGNRTGLTLPDGRTIGYEHDAADQLTKLASPLGNITIDYDGAGRPTLMSKPSGITSTMAYDAADELTKLATTAGGEAVASFHYSYDLAGNVASRAQAVGKTSTTTTYGYDPLRRLTSSVGGPLPSTFGYDAVGNRLTWSAPDDPLTPKPNDPFKQTNVFNAAGQLTRSTTVRQNGNATFTDVTTNTYDDNGNRTLTSTVAQAPGQSHATAYTFDFENRLRTSKPTGDRDERGNGTGQRDHTRSYDALGRLVAETRGKTTTTWTHDGLDPIIASDTDTTLYLRGLGDQLLGEQTDTDDPEWYIADALGSILGTVDGKRKLDNTTSYTDYGVRLDRTNLRVGFGGELADPTLPGNGIGNDTPVLSHYYARSYDPMTGNWLQEDPVRGQLSEPSTLAPHQFVADNPSSKVDLLGMLSVTTTPTWSGTLSVSTTPNWSGTLRVGSGSTATLNGPLQSSNDIANFLQPALSGYTRRSPASKYRAASTLVWSLQGSPLNPRTIRYGDGLTTGMSAWEAHQFSVAKQSFDWQFGVNAASTLADIGQFIYGGVWSGYVTNAGTSVASYIRAYSGQKASFDVFKSASKSLLIASTALGVLNAQDDWARWESDDWSQKLQGGTSLVATGTGVVAIGSATIGVGVVATTVSAAAAGAAATGVGIGILISKTPSYQYGTSLVELNCDWSTCTNWDYLGYSVQATGVGLAAWLTSPFTSDY